MDHRPKSFLPLRKEQSADYANHNDNAVIGPFIRKELRYCQIVSGCDRNGLHFRKVLGGFDGILVTGTVGVRKQADSLQ